MKRAVATGIVAGIILAAVTGCATHKQTPAEDAYLDTMYTQAKHLDYGWTGDVQDAALKLGQSICKDYAKGKTVTELMGAVAAPGDERLTEFNDYAVEAALHHLCPSKE